MSGVTAWEEDDDILHQEEVRSTWSEERCEELWDKVEGVRHKLTRILNPAKLTPYLRQCKVIDEQDEDEVLNSTQYPLRVSKAGRLLDILRGQGQRGIQAFMESLEFYHPEQFTQLTGQQPMQRCSLILDEEGPEGLTQFLLLEVRKLREQLRHSRVCERRLSQRCRVAEDERGRAERRAQDLRHDRLQLERLRQEGESAGRELSRLKDRHLEQAVKYSRALEDQKKSSVREKELLSQVEQLKSRLTAAESHNMSTLERPVKRNSVLSITGHRCSPAAPEPSLAHTQVQILAKDLGSPASGVIALMDILQQDRREAAEQRHELCSIISRLREEMQGNEQHSEKMEVQSEQLQLKVRTLQLDCETEQKRSVSYFNQIMELEKERDQALRSRDSLQLEFTDCLLDKNRLRKRMAELQSNLEQQQRELEREREQPQPSSSCLHCSHLSLCSEDQCYDPCCSLGLDLSPLVHNNNNNNHPLMRKAPPRGQHDEDSNSEEFLLSSTEDNEKEINRLSTFPFPPCVNSINRRFNTEFDLDSWGSDENDNIAGAEGEPSLWDSWTSLHSHLFPPDLVHLPAVPPHGPAPEPAPEPPSAPPLSPPLSPPSPSTPPSQPGRTNLADDLCIVGGNRTGVFVSQVRPGSAAERLGLKEGSELLELQGVLFGGGSVVLNQCTAEVAHFSLQWWTEPDTLKHRSNPEGFSRLLSQISSPDSPGPDSFYVRVNLSLDPVGEPPSLSVTCDDIVHVTDTRYKGRYQWRCSLVDKRSTAALQTGTMPNYNRAQQLLLVRLRKLAVEQKDVKKKKFVKKTPGHVRLVKAVEPAGRGGVGSAPQVLYTLSKRHEEHLIPYSLVQPVTPQKKRPVIFSPSLLSRGLIERLLQPVDSGLRFDTCPPEPLEASERRDGRVFLLDQDRTLGIRLQKIQEVMSQDKHCLLELSLPSVEPLLRHGVYPIVIHIPPKNKKHRKLRKFFPGCGDDGVMEEACQAEELLLETLPMLHFTLDSRSWSCSEELLAAINAAISSQQGAVAWVEPDRLQ